VSEAAWIKANKRGYMETQTDDEIAKELARYTLRKTRLQVQKLQLEIDEIRVESFRKWLTLAAVLTGVGLTLWNTLDHDEHKPVEVGHGTVQTR
jgi:hypothetical protein